jgi:hypothetical protein
MDLLRVLAIVVMGLQTIDTAPTAHDHRTEARQMIVTLTARNRLTLFRLTTTQPRLPALTDQVVPLVANPHLRRIRILGVGIVLRRVKVHILIVQIIRHYQARTEPHQPGGTNRSNRRLP